MAGLEEERRLMYVACTRAMDRLFFSDSEGFNVQNSLSKYPSRFIREAGDGGGPLYIIEGDFDPSLWDDTNRLISDFTDSDEEKPVRRYSPGNKVQHPVFGKGSVLDSDPDTGTINVSFSAYGVRRVSERAVR